jgi:hypothetical protein
MRSRLFRDLRPVRCLEGDTISRADSLLRRVSLSRIAWATSYPVRVFYHVNKTHGPTILTGAFWGPPRGNIVGFCSVTLMRRWGLNSVTRNGSSVPLRRLIRSRDTTGSLPAFENGQQQRLLGLAASQVAQDCIQPPIEQQHGKSMHDSPGAHDAGRLCERGRAFHDSFTSL